ncbi:MAG: ABC transporter substrate-binding protein [Saccharospirillum sp.]|nr:ABC transporter substrate-binding protein [Saccharospirillum sp.]
MIDSRKAFLTAVRAFFLFLLSWSVLGLQSALAVKVVIACGAVGIERQLCIEGAERWASQTGNEVDVIATPESSTERLAMYQLLLRERHDTVDVFQIDVIWPGLLHQWLLDLTPYINDQDAFFPNLVANNTIEDRLIALPWYVDTGLLYYRQDLLQQYGHSVPETWHDLERIALDVQNQQRSRSPDFWGYVWQGSDYEGLTCNIVEWLVSADAGNVVNENQEVTLNNQAAIGALEQAAGWVGQITPSEVLDYREEDARAHFESGNALFMRNWPYAWSLGNREGSAVAGKIGVTVLPRGDNGQSTGALGGWQLGVTQATRHPDEAVDLIRFLTSEAEQRRRTEHGYLPTRSALYEDPSVTGQNPLFEPVGRALENVALRPSSATDRLYKHVSRYLSQETHDVLAGRKTAEAAVESITQRIVDKSLGRYSVQ